LHKGLRGFHPLLSLMAKDEKMFHSGRRSTAQGFDWDFWDY